MKRPRRIEYEIAGFEEHESYHYWEQYAEALEKYADHLEAKNPSPPTPAVIKPECRNYSNGVYGLFGCDLCDNCGEGEANHLF